MPDELAIGRADGRYMKLLKQLAKIDVLVIDDWELAVLDDAHRRHRLEVLDDRHGSGSTIVTSQLPIEHWHAAIGNAHPGRRHPRPPGPQGVQFDVEQLSSLAWNKCPVCAGTTVQFAANRCPVFVEYGF